MTLSHRLRTLMRWRGIKSQHQLARISGVPQSSIHRILLRGEDYCPQRSTLQRLAKALDTTVSWLSEGVERAPLAQETASLREDSAYAQYEIRGNRNGYSAEAQALIARMPDPVRKKVVAILRLIVEGAVQGGASSEAQSAHFFRLHNEKNRS